MRFAVKMKGLMKWIIVLVVSLLVFGFSFNHASATYKVQKEYAERNGSYSNSSYNKASGWKVDGYIYKSAGNYAMGHTFSKDTGYALLTLASGGVLVFAGIRTFMEYGKVSAFMEQQAKLEEENEKQATGAKKGEKNDEA